MWRAPLVIDVLRNLPFLRHVPARAVEVRRVGLGYRVEGLVTDVLRKLPFLHHVPAGRGGPP